MGNFESPLLLEYLDGRQWRITAGFRFVPLKGSVIEVPAGFITDFASVPRIFWRIFPPTGEYGKAAVIHDYLYHYPGTRNRGECDAILFDGMEVLGCGWWTRHLIHKAVRMGGWRPWGKYRDAEKAHNAAPDTL